MNAIRPKHPDEAPTSNPAAEREGFQVLDACHRRMLAMADALERLVETLEREGATPAARAAAAAIVEFHARTARPHHEDEERHIFPALLASGNAALVQAAARLHQDHGWLEQDWLELEPHVSAVAAGLCGWDIDLLRDGASILAALQRDHIALEESIAYPEARSRMASDACREMNREMTARRRADRATARRSAA